MSVNIDHIVHHTASHLATTARTNLAAPSIKHYPEHSRTPVILRADRASSSPSAGSRHRARAPPSREADPVSRVADPGVRRLALAQLEVPLHAAPLTEAAPAHRTHGLAAVPGAVVREPLVGAQHSAAPRLGAPVDQPACNARAPSAGSGTRIGGQLTDMSQRVVSSRNHGKLIAIHVELGGPHCLLRSLPLFSMRQIYPANLDNPE